MYRHIADIFRLLFLVKLSILLGLAVSTVTAEIDQILRLFSKDFTPKF